MVPCNVFIPTLCPTHRPLGGRPHVVNDHLSDMVPNGQPLLGLLVLVMGMGGGTR